MQALALALALLAQGDRPASGDRAPARIDPPPGWSILKQTAYPSVIAVLSHPGGGRITLSGVRLAPADTPDRLAQRNRAVLEKQGMKIGKLAPAGDAVELLATSRDGRAEIRQLYFQRGVWGFILTLTTPAPKMAQYTKDLDTAWHSIH
jgi:hypothetical protein